MLSDFPTLLRQRLARKKPSLRALAHAFGHSPGAISDVASGRRKPPISEVAGWADFLGLTGEERSGFILAAGLSRSPVVVCERVQELEARVRELEGLLEQAKPPKPKVTRRRKG